MDSLGLLGPDGLPLPPPQDASMLGGAPAMGDPMMGADPMMAMGDPMMDPMAQPPPMMAEMAPPPPSPPAMPQIPPSFSMPYEEPPPPEGPIYPKWQLDKNGENKLKKRKPTNAYIDAAINSDQMRFSDTVKRFLEDIQIYRKTNSTIFDSMAIDDVEAFQIGDVSTTVNKIANMIHGIDAVFEWCYSNQDEQTDSQLLEDFSTWMIRELGIRHAWSGSAMLKWDWAWYALVYGRIVSRILPDPEDEEFPWNYTLFDPATVFPVFGGKKGLVRVSCVYNASVDVMLQQYGDNAKFVKELTKQKGDDKGYPDLDYVGEVREYYDPWYRRVTFDTLEAMPTTAHELGYVPFVYTMGPGEAGSAAAPAHGTLTRREIEAGYATSTTSTGMDLAQKGVSFFHHLKPTLQQMEMVLSVAMTSVKQRVNPPMMINSPYDDYKPLDMRSGATNKLRMNETATPILNSIQPADIGLLLGKLQEDAAKGMLPDQVFGVNNASNVSGFQANSMITAAKDQVQPVITNVEQHIADIIDMANRQYRDFGYLVTDNAFPVQEYGRTMQGNRTAKVGKPQMQMMAQMTQMLGQGDPSGLSSSWNAANIAENVPQSQPEARVLSRELIIRMGSRPRVKLESIALQDKTMLGNYVNMMVQGKMMSRARAMAEAGISNPQREWKDILAEDAMTNPKILEFVTYPEAIWESGNESAFFAYFATTIWPAMMQMMMGGQQGGAPGAPPTGGDPALGGGAQTVQGDSQPMVGQGPGAGSGPAGQQLAPDPMAGGGI